MNPGKLRLVLQLIKPSRVQDETGQRVDGWELVTDQLRAAKLAQPGGETTTSAGVQTIARVPTTFHVRKPQTFSIDPTMRLVHKTTLFQILGAVDVEGRDHEMVVTALELVGEPPWQSST